MTRSVRASPREPGTWRRVLIGSQTFPTRPTNLAFHGDSIVYCALAARLALGRPRSRLAGPRIHPIHCLPRVFLPPWAKVLVLGTVRLALSLVLQPLQILLEFFLHVRNFVHLLAAQVLRIVSWVELGPLTLHTEYPLAQLAFSRSLHHFSSWLLQHLWCLPFLLRPLLTLVLLRELLPLPRLFSNLCREVKGRL